MYTIHFSELLQSKNSFHPLQMNRFKWMVESVMHNVTHFGRGAVLDLEILWHLDSCLTDWNWADKNFLSWSSSSPLSSYSIPLRISESTKGIYPFEFDQKNFARASWKCHKFSSKICLSHWPVDDCTGMTLILMLGPRIQKHSPRIQKHSPHYMIRCNLASTTV